MVLGQGSFIWKYERKGFRKSLLQTIKERGFTVLNERYLFTPCSVTLFCFWLGHQVKENPSYIMEICPRHPKGLAAQDYRCAECKLPIAGNCLFGMSIFFSLLDDGMCVCVCVCVPVCVCVCVREYMCACVTSVMFTL